MGEAEKLVETVVTAALGKSGKKILASLMPKKTVRGRVMYKRTWDYFKAGSVSAVNMYLPFVFIEWFASSIKGGTVKKQASAFADKDGKFEFKKVYIHDAYIKITLFYKGNKVVKIYGYDDISTDEAYWVRKGKLIRGKVDIDAAKLTGAADPVDVGDVEVTNSKFRDICDTYVSFVYGHGKMVDKAGYNAPVVTVFYPVPGNPSYLSGGRLYISKAKVRMLTVILHEWGHYLTHKLLGDYHKDATWPGGLLYDYESAGKSHTDSNWNDRKYSHGPGSKEHFESAFDEGMATFFSAILCENPKYHGAVDMNLDTDKNKAGAHNEASVQGALWHFLKASGVDFKKDFWKVFTDTSKRKARTAWSFWDNYKDSGRPKLAELKKAYGEHGMKRRYDFKTGTNRFKKVGSPKKYSERSKQFRRRSSLWKAFSAGGTKAEYYEEFYNRNNKFNTGKPPNPTAAGIWDTGATYTNPKCKNGKKYDIPVESKAK